MTDKAEDSGDTDCDCDYVDPAIWPLLIRALSLMRIDDTPDDDDEEPFF